MTEFTPSDKTYTCPKGEVPLILVDLRVLIHKYVSLAKKLPKDKYYLIWEMCFNMVHKTVSKSIKKARIVVMDDCKDPEYGNYWRQKWIEDKLVDFPEYKGNRKGKEKPPEFYELLEEAYIYIDDNDIPFFKGTGFEADDFVACFARVKKIMDNTRHTFSFTVDNDHGQLVDDRTNFMFYCCGSFRVPVSKLRKESDFIKYYSEREKAEMEHPREILQHKMLKGDRGDNLPKNSPRELIDLLLPPVSPEYCYARVLEELNNTESNVNVRLGSTAQLEIENLTY